jgi:hypothetical protein
VQASSGEQRRDGGPQIRVAAGIVDCDDRYGSGDNGPLSKAKLSERLIPLDAQIGGLEEEAQALRREEAELLDREEDERIMLRRFEVGLPDDLDALTPSQRCEFYRRLGLKALVNQHRSITLTWFMDVHLEVIRCQEEGTSTR